MSVQPTGFADSQIATPCNRVCVVDAGSRLCIGCGRSLDEIGRWTAMTAAEREKVMALLPARLAAVSGGTEVRGD